MKTAVSMATAGAAFLVLSVSAPASNASLLFQSGETMGLAYGAPLPEGVFAIDLENYGKSDGAPNHLGVNIPVIVWATPFVFYDTRLEVLYGAPFVHQDGLPGAVHSRVDFDSQALGPILAHSFGNGVSMSVSGFLRTPDVAFHDYTGADIRMGLSYTANGYNLSATFGYSGTFGGHQGLGLPAIAGYQGASDGVNVDLTATKKFGKLEIGAVGYAFTEINTRLDNVGFNPDGAFDKRQGAIAVGGLVGYDFGRFTIQGMVTRQVAKRFDYNGVDQFGNAGYGGKETRGWIRFIVPLYVASGTPAPVVARY
jgi:hypothetical protein